MFYAGAFFQLPRCRKRSEERRYTPRYDARHLFTADKPSSAAHREMPACRRCDARPASAPRLRRPASPPSRRAAPHMTYAILFTGGGRVMEMPCRFSECRSPRHQPEKHRQVDTSSRRLSLSAVHAQADEKTARSVTDTPSICANIAHVPFALLPRYSEEMGHLTRPPPFFLPSSSPPSATVAPQAIRRITDLSPLRHARRRNHLITNSPPPIVRHIATICRSNS